MHCALRSLAASLILFGVLASAAAADTKAAPVSKVAPVDEYFGRLHISPLGVGNMIKDMKARIEADASKTPSIYGTLADAENALHDWESKYPSDSWIPKNLSMLEGVYLEAAEDKAHENGIRIEAWLEHDYPQSQYTVVGKATLAKFNAAAAAPPVAAQPPAAVPANGSGVASK